MATYVDATALFRANFRDIFDRKSRHMTLGCNHCGFTLRAKNPQIPALIHYRCHTECPDTVWELETEIDHAPGGIGYEKAKKEFEELAKQ